MNAPQWKPLPDAPGLWIIEPSNLKFFQVIEISNFQVFNKCNRVTRAYGPIPLETASQDAPGSTIDRADDKQPGKSNRNALQQAETAGAPKTNEQSIADLRADFDMLSRKLNDIDRNSLENVDSLRELIKSVGRAQIDFASKLSARIDQLRRESDSTQRDIQTIDQKIVQERSERESSDFSLRQQFAGMERTPDNTIKRLTEIESRLALHEKDLAEILTDNAEADKKILANAGAIARIVRHLDRLPEEILRQFWNQPISPQQATKELPADVDNIRWIDKKRGIRDETQPLTDAAQKTFADDSRTPSEQPQITPDITDPTATAWNTNPTIDPESFM